MYCIQVLQKQSTSRAGKAGLTIAKSDMYGLLSKVGNAPPSLCVNLRTTLAAAAHVAMGDAADALAAFQHIDTTYQSKAYELAVLQAVPYVGVPRVLHSAACLQVGGIVGDHCDVLRDEELREKGDKLFSDVYGRHSKEVQGRIQEMHPALEDWIIRNAYGSIFSRKTAGGLDISVKERELCAVSMLCTERHATVQLASHLRGCLRVGANEKEIEYVMDQTGLITGSEMRELTRGVWQTFDRARYVI